MTTADEFKVIFRGFGWRVVLQVGTVVGVGGMGVGVETKISVSVAPVTEQVCPPTKSVVAQTAVFPGETAVAVVW